MNSASATRPRSRRIYPEFRKELCDPLENPGECRFRENYCQGTGPCDRFCLPLVENVGSRGWKVQLYPLRCAESGSGGGVQGGRPWRPGWIRSGAPPGRLARFNRPAHVGRTPAPPNLVAPLGGTPDRISRGPATPLSPWTPPPNPDSDPLKYGSPHSYSRPPRSPNLPSPPGSRHKRHKGPPARHPTYPNRLDRAVRAELSCCALVRRRVSWMGSILTVELVAQPGLRAGRAGPLSAAVPGLARSEPAISAPRRHRDISADERAPARSRSEQGQGRSDRAIGQVAADSGPARPARSPVRRPSYTLRGTAPSRP